MLLALVCSESITPGSRSVGWEIFFCTIAVLWLFGLRCKIFEVELVVETIVVVDQPAEVLETTK